MKILQINKYLKNVGGAETYMFQLSNSLKEKTTEAGLAVSATNP